MGDVSTVNAINVSLYDEAGNRMGVQGNALEVADSAEREYTHVTATVTASGNTTVYTPTSGKAVRLHWVYAINDPKALTSTRITISLGGTVLYNVWALSKRQVKTGPVNGTLVVNLNGSGNVAFTAILEEV